MQRIRFLALAFIGLFFMSILYPVDYVLAAEEEEEDNFTTMPNYRWENQSTTDSAVTEQLIGDNYEVYNYNNATTGTQKFEKSRELNSRDFYFESRFALDVGGNQTEYFRDVLGDACDWEEGDVEGWIGLVSMSASDGLLSAYMAVETEDVLIFPTQIDVSTEVYHTLEIRIKSNVDDLQVKFTPKVEGEFYKDYSSFVELTDTWQTVIYNKEDNVNWNGDVYSIIKNLRIVFDEVGGDGTLEATDRVWIDWIELIGDLDYATHVESEVEDTWDWEDSDEYWYDEEGNVSDFADGTTEDWIAYDTDTVIDGVTNGWLNTSLSDSVDFIWIWDNDVEITAADYMFFAAEIYCESGSIDMTVITDTDGLASYTDTTDVLVGETHLIAGELTDYWTGTEYGIGMRFCFTTSAITHAVNINMTYLYDVALGDIEGTDNINEDYSYINPLGFNTLIPDSGGSARLRFYPVNIDTTIFDTLSVRVQSYSNIQVRVYGHQLGGSDAYLSEIQSMSGNEWYEFEFDLESDSDWTDIYDGISLLFLDDVGGFEGDEYIHVDYILLLGHWSTTDGFKYSLLNADDEEGMSFQFTRNSDSFSSYNLSIDMYDSVGVALDYTYSFNYSIDTDGWLRLRVDWHLDKRYVKILLEFDNGTIILKVRRITDLYGGNLGLSNLLLLKDGFPSLCMNNSISALARSYVIINYIDADWDILDWRDPGSPVWTYNWGSKSNYADSYFTAISPYGLTAYHKDRGDTYKFYRLTADRFDGLSFDVSTEVANLDTGAYNDWAGFGLCIYNVQPNGTAMFIGEIFTETMGGALGTSCGVYNATGDIIHEIKLASGYEDQQLDFSFGHESAQKSIMHFHYKTETFDEGRQLSFGKEFTEDFTQEYTFILYYGYRTSQAGADDDEIDILMGNFDLIRKDLGESLLAAILGPVFWFFSTVAGDFISYIISIPLAPFIFLFQALGLLIIRALKDLATALEPFFDVLGGIFSAAISGLQTFLDPIWTWLSDIVDEIMAIAATIWTAFIAAAGNFLTALLNAALALISLIIDLGAGILFTIWDALGLPDLLAILKYLIDLGVLLWSHFLNFLVGAVATVTWLLATIEYWIWWPLAFMWGWIWFVPTFKVKNAMDWIDIGIKRCFTNISPGQIELYGFTVFPNKFPLIIPLLVGTIWVLGVGI